SWYGPCVPSAKMRSRFLVGGIVLCLAANTAFAAKATTVHHTRRKGPAALVQKALHALTSRRVAVHVANSATRGSLRAGSVGLNSVAVGVGGVDGLVAAAGLARQLHSKSLREVLHDPVTETLASIGAAGVGNALRIAGLPILAEASFSGGALLGTHSIK